MAEKAGDLIKDALNEIVVLGAELTLEADDAQLSLRYLNRMMAALSAKGVDLGWTELSNTGQEITSPAGATEGIISLLAVRLWKPFTEGEPIPQALLATAADGMKTLMILGVKMGQTEYPDTLPIGSGNEGDPALLLRHYYPALQDDILAEATGSVGLETGTE